MILSVEYFSGYNIRIREIARKSGHNAPRSASVDNFMINMNKPGSMDNVKNMDDKGNKDSMLDKDNKDSMPDKDNKTNEDDKANFFPGIIYTFLWINLAVFVAWPLSAFLAPLYVFLLPFSGCISPFEDILDGLQKAIKLPRTWVEKGIEMRPPTDCTL
ncbi:hypothetical protein Aperf_G00000069513 [Anoplocephala perfoliata]